MNPLLACLLLFFLLLTFPLLIPFASAQIKTKEKVPMAHRASQAQRYSATRGLATTEAALPVNISSTVIEQNQPLRIKSSHIPYAVNILDPNGKEVLKEKVNTHQIWIKTDTLHSGIYQIKIEADKKNYSYSVSIK